MPYKDPEKAKAAKRKYYNRRYAESPEFRLAESDRKASYFQEHKEEHARRMVAWRRRQAAQESSAIVRQIEFQDDPETKPNHN